MAVFTPTATDAPGTYTLTASYAGNSNYGGASSPQVNNFSIGKQTTATAVTLVNPPTEATGA